VSPAPAKSILAIVSEEDAQRAAADPRPWELPIPLDDPADTPPPFPLDALPGPLADLCANIGETIGCPPDYAATFALAAMAGTCGSAVALNVKPDWEEHASLFVCAVAPPTAGKTPSFKLVTRPVVEEQTRRVAAGEKCPAYVGDITVEKLADVLKDSPRGTLLLRDELAAWVKGMDQYKSRGGSDRQFYLSAWSSDPVSVHRKNPDSPHVFIAHPCLSVAGGIQPEVLAALKGNDDGFFDRILFTFPAPHPAKEEDWKVCDRRLVRRWADALAAIRGFDMPGGPEPRPHFVALGAAGRERWRAFTADLAGRMNAPDFPRHLTGVAGKLRGYGARLALVSMLLRAGYDGDLEDVTADDVDRGARLAFYFFAHAQRVYRVMARDPAAEGAAKVLGWVRSRAEATFTRRDAYRGLRRQFARPEDLADPLRRLVQHGFIRYAGGGAPDASGAGRHPTAHYEVHPSCVKGGDSGDTQTQTPKRQTLTASKGKR